MNRERSIFIKLCMKGIQDKGLASDERYKERFKKELKEVDAQAEHEYYLRLYQKFKKENLVFPENEHNNIVDYLLGLTNQFDIEKESAYVQGEFPDIDIDYAKPVRDYLKREWAPKTFGQENICEIGTYGTSGIKSALLDMARVHGENHHEIQLISKKIEDKDEEGKPLEWDDLLEIAKRDKQRQEEEKKNNRPAEQDSNYIKFADWCEKHPDVALASKTLLGRNRTGGVHAGGLIISDKRIDGFVPLEVRSVDKKNPQGVICSAWTEGLNAQDLQPVGLIKFDLLVINNLMQIALACKLVKERHGLENICALPGSWDWSDISYLNDPKSLELANNADLKCIFQFDSEGIRKLVKRGGVTSFDDLVAYSALYRPGPLGMGMDARYCKRKKNEEPFNLHPAMEPLLGRTYGVMCYQEQVMDILRVVGGIPDMHTEKVRKAISKKKSEVFGKYKVQFVESGQKVLDCGKNFVKDLWDQVESFAEYGFNKSHACAYTYISSRLLWLKAHYPVEFYTAILMCENDHDKFKEYKLDAKYHDVAINPVHINKSRENFHIEDESVFFGFQNIKGIGNNVAERLVAHQPYKDFMDFLNKFSTDDSVASPSTAIKALTALGCFEEPYDRATLKKFADFYKDQAKKRRDRQKRFESSMDKKLEELKELLLSEVSADDPDLDVMSDFTEEADEKWKERFSETIRVVEYKSKGQIKTKEVTFYSLLEKLAARRESSRRNFEEKEREAEEEPITLDIFNSAIVELDEKDKSLYESERILGEEKSYPEAEKAFYGFEWISELETSPEYSGDTIDKMLNACENENLAWGRVEVIIRSVRKRVSKGQKKTEFYTIGIEDANGKTMNMNMWMDDYLRFKDKVIEGNMVKMHVRPPSGGFNTLTFKSVPRHERRNLPDPELDDRLLLMSKMEVPKEEKVDLSELKFEEFEGFEEI